VTYGNGEDASLPPRMGFFSALRAATFLAQAHQAQLVDDGVGRGDVPSFPAAGDSRAAPHLGATNDPRLRAGARFGGRQRVSLYGSATDLGQLEADELPRISDRYTILDNQVGGASHLVLATIGPCRHTVDGVEDLDSLG
jgi:hypothetical protein